MGIFLYKRPMDDDQLTFEFSMSKEEEAALYRTAECLKILEDFKINNDLTWENISSIVGISTYRIRKLRRIDDFVLNVEYDKITKLNESI